MTADTDWPGGLRIERPEKPLEREVEDALRRALEACPDVAFAHLPQVFVPGAQERPGLVLFVWLVPAALRSLRQALNLVSEAVARALPPEQYLDVVILNSAPELLEPVERTGCLLVERDPLERERALEAARQAPDDDEPAAGRVRWSG
jgi:hypothetical protein